MHLFSQKLFLLLLVVQCQWYIYYFVINKKLLVLLCLAISIFEYKYKTFWGNPYRLYDIWHILRFRPFDIKIKTFRGNPYRLYDIWHLSAQHWVWKWGTSARSSFHVNHQLWYKYIKPVFKTQFCVLSLTYYMGDSQIRSNIFIFWEWLYYFKTPSGALVCIIAGNTNDVIRPYEAICRVFDWLLVYIAILKKT